MPENPRIEDLRRRVQKDPASIAFAQLAEEYRRAGQHQESVEACRAGLAIHPGYLSARVTLGRALFELGDFDNAETELGLVLKSAPENLAAIRGIADIHHKRGNLPEALQFYQRALGLARNDPDLEQVVSELTRQLKPSNRADSKDGLTLDDMQRELSAHVAAASAARSAKPAPTPPVPAPKVVAPPSPAPVVAPPAAPLQTVTASRPAPAPARPSTSVPKPPPAFDPDATIIQKAPAFLRRTAPAPAPIPVPAPVNPGRERAIKTVAALEKWLDAINVTRAQRVP
jgi:tetratricopeptide (TPR) repeat protein